MRIKFRVHGGGRPAAIDTARLGDGNEEVGRREIDKSWSEPIKILLRYEPGCARLWHTINERYPCSMIEKASFVTAG